jgi:hypothetical protein
MPRALRSKVARATLRDSTWRGTKLLTFPRQWIVHVFNENLLPAKHVNWALDAIQRESSCSKGRRGSYTSVVPRDASLDVLFSTCKLCPLKFAKIAVADECTNHGPLRGCAQA